MAFKLKASKEGPMMKNFPSVFKNDERLKKMAKNQKDKYGGGKTDVFGLKILDADMSTKSGVGSYTYKNISYETREDMFNAIRKNNPKSKALPENKKKKN
tara:strand:- start:74 stop:373 length:300 start_codon:yes stop_codon:yes gene_type:complete